MRAALLLSTALSGTALVFPTVAQAQVVQCPETNGTYVCTAASPMSFAVLMLNASGATGQNGDDPVFGDTTYPGAGGAGGASRSTSAPRPER